MEAFWFAGSFFMDDWIGNWAWEGEDLVEVTVVGNEVFLDELLFGLVDGGGLDLEKGLDALVAVEAQSLPVGGEAEEEVEELGVIGEAGEEAVDEDAAGEPGKGLFDGSDAVVAQWGWGIHGVFSPLVFFFDDLGGGISSSGGLRGGPSMQMVLQWWRSLESRASTIFLLPRKSYHSS